MKTKLNLIKRLIVTAFLIIPGLVLLGCGETGTSGSTNIVKLATNNTQTSWFQYSTSLSELLKNDAENPISVDVMPIAGGVGNVGLLQQGEADFALLHNVASGWAYNGEVAFDEPVENLRGLAAGLNDYYIGVVARTKYLEDNGIESIADIKEKEVPVRFITNEKGTLAELVSRLTLEAYGLDYDAIDNLGGSVELTSNDIIKNSFQDGAADLHILVISKGHPVINEISLTTDITLLGLEDDIINSLVETHGFNEDIYPSGQYKGQDYEVQTVGFVSSYIATTDMDEETAYTIAKVINENKEALVQGHNSVNDFDPENAANEDLLGVPLHPGAKKYYEEKGLLE